MLVPSAGPSRGKQKKVSKAHLFPDHFCQEGTSLPTSVPSARTLLGLPVDARVVAGSATPARSPHQRRGAWDTWSSTHLPAPFQARLVLEATQASVCSEHKNPRLPDHGTKPARDAKSRNPSIDFPVATQLRHCSGSLVTRGLPLINLKSEKLLLMEKDQP